MLSASDLATTLPAGRRCCCGRCLGGAGGGGDGGAAGRAAAAAAAADALREAGAAAGAGLSFEGFCAALGGRGRGHRRHARSRGSSSSGSGSASDLSFSGGDRPMLPCRWRQDGRAGASDCGSVRSAGCGAAARQPPAAAQPMPFFY